MDKKLIQKQVMNIINAYDKVQAIDVYDKYVAVYYYGRVGEDVMGDIEHRVLEIMPYNHEFVISHKFEPKYTKNLPKL